MFNRIFYATCNEREQGAVAVVVAICLFMLIAFTALAVDTGHLYVVRNELQNAADAGALAGALNLFNSDGSINNGANQEANDVSTGNTTGNVNVSELTVERGHWSFASQTFTANPSLTQVAWQERPFADLDVDTDFINAVRVETRRSDAPSFFARIFNYDQFFVATDAVAYIGFAGSFQESDFDQPIAICKEAIWQDGHYTCNMGRMLNSGASPGTHNTGAWTNFTQPCDTASASYMRSLVCADGNPNDVNFGQGIGATGGVQDATLADLVDCWVASTDTDGDGIPDTLWDDLTLPVVLCPGNNVSNCAELVGAVTLHLIWIIHRNDPHYDDVPLAMNVPDYLSADPGNWACSIVPANEDERKICWREFIDHFNLQNVDGSPQNEDDYDEMYQKKNMFFLPSCDVEDPVGGTGGENFGILAKYPKLVE